RAEACSWARARSSPAFFPWCPSRPRSPPSSSRSSTPGASPRAASTQAPRSTTRRAAAASRCRPSSAAAGSSASGPEELDELRVGEQRDAFLRAERARVLRHLAGRDVDAAFGAAALGGCEEIAERLGAGAHGFPALAGDETPHAVSLQVEVTVAAASARNAAHLVAVAPERGLHLARELLPAHLAQILQPLLDATGAGRPQLAPARDPGNDEERRGAEDRIHGRHEHPHHGEEADRHHDADPP